MALDPTLGRYAWLSIGTALLTLAIKWWAWWVTGSVGLLSDAMEGFVNLGAALLDYEERRKRDRRKLEVMEEYCRTAQCRARVLLRYFEADPGEGYRCGHCDNCAD